MVWVALIAVGEGRYLLPPGQVVAAKAVSKNDRWA